MNIDILQDGTGFTEVDPGAKHLLSIRCEDGKVGKQKPSASRELVQPFQRWAVMRHKRATSGKHDGGPTCRLAKPTSRGRKGTGTSRNRVSGSSRCFTLSSPDVTIELQVVATGIEHVYANGWCSEVALKGATAGSEQ